MLKQKESNMKVELISEHSSASLKKLLENKVFASVFQVISFPVINRSYFRIQAVKHGFMYEKENGYEIYTYGNHRIAKVQFDGKWIQINPELPEELKLLIETLIEMIPEDFSFYIGNNPFKKKDLKKYLIFKNLFNQ
jgi:hypothetical protein